MVETTNLGASLGLIDALKSGGWVMLPLVVCSLLVWYVVFERWYRYRSLRSELKSFHLRAQNFLLRSDLPGLSRLCGEHPALPTSKLVTVALDRLGSKDERLKSRWKEAVERERQSINMDLRKNLWILGTIASGAPFIGLAGTVVGILRSFHEMATTGKGGFTVVAGGISEALIATAAGIIVAIVASFAFNIFQTRWSEMILGIRNQIQEIAELLGDGT